MLPLATPTPPDHIIIQLLLHEGDVLHFDFQPIRLLCWPGKDIFWFNDLREGVKRSQRVLGCFTLLKSCGRQWERGEGMISLMLGGWRSTSSLEENHRCYLVTIAQGVARSVVRGIKILSCLNVSGGHLLFIWWLKLLLFLLHCLNVNLIVVVCRDSDNFILRIVPRMPLCLNILLLNLSIL